MKDEYDVIKIPGKHGEIHLHVPKRESTQEEIDDFYRTLAEITIDDAKKKPAE